jgi:hypothetical protein
MTVLPALRVERRPDGLKLSWNGRPVSLDQLDLMLAARDEPSLCSVCFGHRTGTAWPCSCVSERQEPAASVSRLQRFLGGQIALRAHRSSQSSGAIGPHRPGGPAVPPTNVGHSAASLGVPGDVWELLR